MRAYVAVTDKDWYQFLEGRPDLDEVNFWQPSGNRVFGTLKAGEPFLFGSSRITVGLFPHSEAMDEETRPRS